MSPIRVDDHGHRQIGVLDAPRDDRVGARAGDLRSGPPDRSIVLLQVALGVSATFSVFLPEIGSLPPLVTVIAVLLIIRMAPDLHAIPAQAAAVLGLAAAAILSCAWSPDTHMALAAIAYYLQVAGLVLVGRESYRRGISVLPLVTAWCAAATTDAVLVLYFRFEPAAEIAWLKSPIAPYLINPGTLGKLFTDSPNNILDPAKSGAFFVNANAGSAFLGAAFCVALFLYAQTHRRRWIVIATIDAAAVVASGSSAGIIILGAILGVLVVRALAVRPPTAPLIPFVVLASFWLLSVTYQAVLADMGVWARFTLWKLAASAIAQNPLLGLGYGAWDTYAARSFAAIGSSTYPPHNLILYTWIQSGLIAAALLLFFLYSAVHGLRGARSVPGVRMVMAAVVWSFVYSLGDNTQLLNDMHSAPALAVLLGYLGARGHQGAQGRGALGA